MRLRDVGLLLVPLAAIGFGCNAPEEKFGRTWYLDGAGNWGFGVSEATYGLRKAGYKGQVSAFHWSITMSPLADQVLKPLSGFGAARLSGCISDYLRRHPDKDVNIIALSAGGGVALKAVELLKPPQKINNIILLASSVSCQYDVKSVLKNMKGKIYVYYSQNDAMLSGPVKVLGAFGGKLGDDPAGLCGLYAPNTGGRVVNIAWHPRFSRYGWHGSHTSCTAEPFVQHILAKHILTPESGATYYASARRGGAQGTPSGDTAGDTRLARANVREPARREGARRSGEGSRTAKSRAAKPRPPRYAPPLGSELSAAIDKPVVRPGQSAAFMTLSRRDPRFPSLSYLQEGFRVRLIGVPGSKTARLEVRPHRKGTPTVQDMAVEMGQRYTGTNGHAWAVTLLRVDPPSQTAWLQVRQMDARPEKKPKPGTTPVANASGGVHREPRRLAARSAR